MACLPKGFKLAPDDRSTKRERHARRRAVSKDSLESDASTVDMIPACIFGSPASPCDDSSSDSDVEFPGENANKCAALKHAVAATMYDASTALPWVESSFQFVHKLQLAERNHGVVELMQSVDSGHFVAVKKMPNTWMRSDPEEFCLIHGTSSEQPWLDLGIANYLQSQSWPFLCQPLGFFYDSLNTYVLSSYATEGDLFTWCESLPAPGCERNAAVKPVGRQVLSAVKSLHDLGIAHCDLSLENIVVTTEGQGDIRIKLIDFGLARLDRKLNGQVRAKPSYQPPEAHRLGQCDGFLADSFACGVILFAMAAYDYPWLSTKPGVCSLFANLKIYGLRNCIEQHNLQVDSEERTALEVLPRSLIDLIVGLLALRPSDRFTLGEECWDLDCTRPSVWDNPWLALAS